MEIHFFEEISSENKILRDAAGQQIQEAMQDPNYIAKLFDLIDIAKGSSTATTNLLYVIFLMMRSNTYAYETIIPISEKLFQLFYVLSFHDTQHILRCFSPICREHSRVVRHFVDQFIPVVAAHETREITATALLFLERYFSLTYCNSSLQDFSSVATILFPAFLEIYETSVAEIENGETVEISSSILYGTINVFINIIKKNDEILEFDQSPALFLCIIDLISIKNSSPSVLTMKKKLLDLILTPLFQTYAQNINNVAEAKRPFIEYFQTEYCSKLLGELFSLLQIISEPDIIVRIIPIFTAMIEKGILIDELLTESFIVNFIFAASKLLQTDIELLDENPIQYYDFCVAISETSGKDIIRGCIFYLLQKAPIEFNVAITEHISDNLNDVIDLESRIFILAILTHFVPFTDEFIHQSILQIDASTEKIVIIQVLNFFRCLFKETTKNSDISIETNQFATEVACQIILSETDVIVVFAASELLFEVIDGISYDISESFDIHELVSKLLELNIALNQKSIQRLITKITTFYINSIADISIDLMTSYIETWTNIAPTLEEDDEFDDDSFYKYSELLVSMAQLIDAFPVDHFACISENIFLSIFNSLSHPSCSNCYKELSNVLLSLDLRISTTIPQIFSVFDVFLDIVVNEQIYGLKECTDLIIHLISKPDFFASQKVEIINSLIESYCQQTDIEAQISPAPFIYAAVIQYGGVPFAELAIQSFRFIEVVFFPATVLLVSGMLKNEEEIIAQISDELISLWIKHTYKSLARQKERIIKYSVIGLSLLAKHKNSPEIANSAAKAATLIVEGKYDSDSDSESEESNDSEFEVYDYNGDIVDSIPDTPLPNDSIDVISFFKKCMGESGLFTQLDEKYQTCFGN